jgi:hypothetical protein
MLFAELAHGSTSSGRTYQMVLYSARPGESQP